MLLYLVFHCSWYSPQGRRDPSLLIVVTPCDIIFSTTQTQTMEDILSSAAKHRNFLCLRYSQTLKYMVPPSKSVSWIWSDFYSKSAVRFLITETWKITMAITYKELWDHCTRQPISPEKASSKEDWCRSYPIRLTWSETAQKLLWGPTV